MVSGAGAWLTNTEWRLDVLWPRYRRDFRPRIRTLWSSIAEPAARPNQATGCPPTEGRATWRFRYHCPAWASSTKRPLPTFKLRFKAMRTKGAISHANREGNLDYGRRHWRWKGNRDGHGGPLGPHHPIWPSSIRTRHSGSGGSGGRRQRGG